MILEIDDDLGKALEEFCITSPIRSVNLARLLQLAVDYRYRSEAIQGRDTDPAGDVFHGYACTRWPVIARLFREEIARRHFERIGTSP